MNTYVPEAVLLITAGDHVPVIPLFEVAGSVGAVAPEQKAGTVLNVGVTNGFTEIVIDAAVAQNPASGVNVYVPEAVLLTTAGDQVPATPSLEVDGNVGAVDPSQNAGICVKAGVTGDPTVTLIVTACEHWPADGVNVYAVVPAEAVLIVAGDHVPVIPLFDVVAKAGGVEPTHCCGITAKVGVTVAFTVSDNVVVVAHCPADGVNVDVNVPAVEVLKVAGDHVPAIPLVEVAGSVGAVAP